MDKEELKQECLKFWEWMKKTNKHFQEQLKKYAGSSYEPILN